MIKQFSKYIVVLILVVSAPLVAAQGKVAVVDIQAAMLNSEHAKGLLKQMNDNPEFAKLNSTYQSLRADLQAMAQDAAANSKSWDQAKLTEHNKQMQYKNADLQLAGQKLDGEQQAVLQQIQNDMSGKLDAALQQLIESEGLTLLLNRNAALYATPEMDLTAKLAAKLNQ